MQHINDLKIVGIDESRFPRIRKEPYIDLVFKLSHKAPADWCQDFNMLFTNSEYPVKIDANVGLCIETWVRKMDEIAKHLDVLKTRIAECNTDYVKKAQARELAETKMNEASRGASGEQETLNKLIANLKFD